MIKLYTDSAPEEVCLTDAEGARRLKNANLSGKRTEVYVLRGESRVLVRFYGVGLFSVRLLLFFSKGENLRMWESFIEAVTKVNDWVNGVVWGWPMIIMILGTGILLTVRTRVLQVRKFGESMSTTIVPAVKDMGKKKNKKDKNAVSQFEAFSAAISGTVGTGNIIGVTSAILTGGTGAVLWMWISAFFGMVTNYSENVFGSLLPPRKRKKTAASAAARFIT